MLLALESVLLVLLEYRVIFAARLPWSSQLLIALPTLTPETVT